ncbi:MAG: chorismate mutase [Treponema sp.]|jgi:chorismate mutase|nr:chorismate mutase [Treponema sp.]
MKKLFALRGAAQCENTEEDIRRQIGLMYDELLILNKLEESEIVSIIFSVTSDLNAVNPCSALRNYGRAGGDTALFSVQEPECKNSVERIVRVIIHCYLEQGLKIRHIYRNGAEVLRPDRVPAKLQQQ